MQDNIRDKYNALMARPPPKGVPCKNMKTFLLCCLAIGVLVIIMIVVSVETNKSLQPQTESCEALYPDDPDSGPVGCRVCAAGARSNDISHMPFMNLGLAPVSHNLGTYEIFTPGTQQIAVNQREILDAFVGVKGGPDHSVINYVQALGMYFVFAILMCIFTTILGCSILTCKFCCNCSCCGRRTPTEKRGHLLGFEWDDNLKMYHYSSIGRWGSRVFMATFAFFLALWLGLGQINGNLGMTDAMKALTHAPDGLVNVLRGLVPPIAELLENLIGKTFVGLFEGLNRTVTEDVNLEAIINGVECILGGIGSFPNSSVLTNLVVDLEGVFAQLVAILGTSEDALVVVDGELELVRVQVTGIRDYIVGEFSQQLMFLIANLTVLQDECNVFNGFTRSLLNESCCASKAVADMNFLQANHTVNDTEYGDMIAVLTDMLALSCSGPFATFINEMSRLETDMNNAPDLNLTANQLDVHNTEVQEAIDQGKASNLAVGIEDTNAFLNTTTGFTQRLNDTIVNLTGNVLDINLDPIRQIILDFNATLETIPPFSIVTNFILSILSIKDNLFPCMEDVAVQLVQFDRSVAELPAEFLNIDSIISAVNGSLQPAIDAIQDIQNRQTDFDDAKDRFNISDQLSTLNDTENQLSGYVNDINNDDMIQQVSDAENKSHLNISILPDVLRVNESLPGWLINTSDIDEIRRADAARRQLRQDLLILNQDLPLWQGRCTTDISQACTLDSTCTPGTCTPTNNRCRLSIGPCSVDADCPGVGDRCLTDRTRINNTLFNIIVMRGVVFNGTAITRMQTQLNDARAGSDIDTSGLEQGILEANDTLGAVQTGRLTTNLNNVIQNLNDFNSSDFRTQIDDINASLNAIDFQSIIDQINAADDAFHQVDDARSDLDSAYQLLNATRELLFHRLPQVIADFSLAKLRQIRTTQGVAATLDYLATTIDRETAWLDQAAGSIISGANNSEGFATNFTGDLAPYKDLIYTLCDADFGEYGSSYFLVKLAKSFSQAPDMANQIFDPDGTEYDVFKDKNGNEYPFAPNSTTTRQKCVTSTCLDNTIDFLNSGSLREVGQQMLNQNLPVDLSREQAIGLPYIVPLLILICATLSAALFCRTSQIGWWSSCLASCVCCGAFCCMPIIFMIVGMMFPLVIVSGDVCYSVENLGYTMLNDRADMCASFTGTGTITNCVIPWTVRNETHYSTINILDTYTSLVAPGCDPTVGAIHDVFEQAKDAFGDIPTILIENFVNGTDNTSFPINFRPNVKNIFVDAAKDLGVHARQFATGLAGALSCAQLYSIYESFKGAVCCDVISAFYWALGSWYLIAWTLLCCGCCAGLFGRKRFAYELWGEEVLALKDRSQLQRDMEYENDKPRQQREREDSTSSRRNSTTPPPAAVRAPASPVVAVAVTEAPPTYEAPAPAYVAPDEGKHVELTTYPAKNVEDF